MINHCKKFDYLIVLDYPKLSDGQKHFKFWKNARWPMKYLKNNTFLQFPTKSFKTLLKKKFIIINFQWLGRTEFKNTKKLVKQ